MMIAKSIAWGTSAIATILGAAALGLACPASAKLDEGTYSVTYTNQDAEVSSQDDFVVTSCGQDCLTIAVPRGTGDLHLHGNSWTGTTPAPDGECTWAIDDTSLAGRQNCPAARFYDVQLTKNG